MNDVRRVAVLGGIRIPFARQGGPYARASNQDMLTATLDALTERHSLEGETLGEVAAGAVLKHSRDFNLTRECVLGSRLAPETPAYDVQQACGTGLEATIAVANKIALGQIESGIAGGVDTTSDAPIAINDAFRIYMLPQGVFSVAVATVLFPTLSRMAARRDATAMRRTLGIGMRQINLLLIPAATFMIVLATPIVRLVFQRGAFGARSTELVSIALFWFAFSLPFAGVNLLLTRTFFAVQRPWIPTKLAAMNMVVDAIVSIALYKPLGIAGLVIGTASANLVMTVLQLHRLRVGTGTGTRRRRRAAKNGLRRGRLNPQTKSRRPKRSPPFNRASGQAVEQRSNPRCDHLELVATARRSPNGDRLF